VTVEELLGVLSDYGMDDDVVVEVGPNRTEMLAPVTGVDNLFVNVPDAEELFVRLRTD
jgi:hypothetical protein